MKQSKGADDAVAAVQSAAEAVKQVSEERGGGFDHQIRSLAALVTSLAALVASTGAFAKSCDHSVTENSYNALAQGIQEVTAAEQRNHDDLTALHGYVDGLTHGGGLPSPARTGADVGGGNTGAAAGAAAIGPATHPRAIPVPPVPSVHPRSLEWQAPPFDEVVKGIKVPYYGDIEVGGPCNRGVHVLTATWNCDAAKQRRLHCQNGLVTAEPCPNGCLGRPNGQDDVCR